MAVASVTPSVVPLFAWHISPPFRRRLSGLHGLACGNVRRTCSPSIDHRRALACSMPATIPSRWDTFTGWFFLSACVPRSYPCFVPAGCPRQSPATYTLLSPLSLVARRRSQVSRYAPRSMDLAFAEPLSSSHSLAPRAPLRSLTVHVPLADLARGRSRGGSVCFRCLDAVRFLSILTNQPRRGRETLDEDGISFTAIDFTVIMIDVRNQFRILPRNGCTLSKNAARVCAELPSVRCRRRVATVVSSDSRLFPGLSLPPPCRHRHSRLHHGFMLLPHRCHPLCSTAPPPMATASRWPLLFNRNTVTHRFPSPLSRFPTCCSRWESQRQGRSAFRCCSTKQLIFLAFACRPEGEV